MGRTASANAALDWIIQFMRPLPPLSYMILLILWLGTGDLSKGMLLFLTAFPIIVAASAAGVRGVKQQRIQVARALGATRRDVFRHVILPSAAPMIFTGLQIALAAAFSTVVSAELLASTDGLGWMVISASTFLRNDIIILCILVLGGLGVGLAAMLRARGPALSSIGAAASEAHPAEPGPSPCSPCSALLCVWVGVTSGGLVRDLFLPGPADLWDGFARAGGRGLQGPPAAAACRHEPAPGADAAS